MALRRIACQKDSISVRLSDHGRAAYRCKGRSSGGVFPPAACKDGKNSGGKNSRKRISAAFSADGRPVEDKKGLNLLAGYKLTAITKTISKQTDTTYQVTTESLFDTAKVNRSLDFFKGKKYPPPHRKQVKQRIHNSELKRHRCLKRKTLTA